MRGNTLAWTDARSQAGGNTLAWTAGASGPGIAES